MWKPRDTRSSETETGGVDPHRMDPTHDTEVYGGDVFSGSDRQACYSPALDSAYRNTHVVPSVLVHRPGVPRVTLEETRCSFPARWCTSSINIIFVQLHRWSSSPSAVEVHPALGDLPWPGECHNYAAIPRGIREKWTLEAFWSLTSSIKLDIEDTRIWKEGHDIREYPNFRGLLFVVVERIARCYRRHLTGVGATGFLLRSETEVIRCGRVQELLETDAHRTSL